MELPFPEPPREMKIHLIKMNWDFERYKFTKKANQRKMSFSLVYQEHEKIEKQSKKHLAENSDEEAAGDGSLVGQAQAKAQDRVRCGV